jgi:hypothetical protein
VAEIFCHKMQRNSLPNHIQVWNFEFGLRAAQALAPRVGIYLEFGFWCLGFVW